MSRYSGRGAEYGREQVHEAVGNREARETLEPSLVPGDTHSIRRVAEHLVRTRARRFSDPEPDVVRPGANGTGDAPEPALRAIADLHAASRGNRDIVAGLRPEHPGDWLIVAGDVAERLADVADVLATLAERFARVLWVPGNHELWGGREGVDGVPAPARYDVMVEVCRQLGIDTPEDPFPVWDGAGGPAYVVPLFLLYDYSWRPDPAQSRAEAVASARERRVVATDEYLIDPAPFSSIGAWCEDRLRRTTARLAALDPAIPTVLVNHWPLHREPTRALFYPDFAMWCGTEHTVQWPLRYNAAACIYGHLHIPRTRLVKGVRYEEVSLG
ncbi:metallophosphoesterase family protein, partial [Dietzia sp.]|uniref:metallophosphoesterase family protein n=1 Tax=Dietzia sp. TaxID=1871616 RepID=UPI002FDABEA0